MTDDALNDAELPRVIQTAPDRPVFRGFGDHGRDVVCGGCRKVVLLENVSADAIFDIEIKCAACGGVSRMPPFPSGRGLGGVEGGPGAYPVAHAAYPKPSGHTG